MALENKLKNKQTKQLHKKTFEWQDIDVFMGYREVMGFYKSKSLIPEPSTVFAEERYLLINPWPIEESRLTAIVRPFTFQVRSINLS